MAVLDTVKAIAPTQTTGMTDSAINVFIELAVERLGPCQWGDLYSQGVAYLAAHLLTITARGGSGGGTGAAGPVQQEMAGRVMVSYANAAASGGSGSDLNSTPYGQEFLALRRKLASLRPFNTGFSAADMCQED